MAVDGSLKFDTKIDDSGFSDGVSRLSSMAAKGLAAISGAVAGMSAYAIKVGSNFEAGMSEVSAISVATGEDLEMLTNKAKEMGIQTKFSATEASEAMQYMAMAGWKAADMAEGISGIMDLAAASGEDLASVSDIVTDALTAFGLQASDSGHFADVLAKAASNSNTNVGMMGATFKYAAPLAGTLGYSIEDTAVAIGLMANAGIKGEQAGTSMRAMLTRLANPTDEVAGAMETLGIEIANADGSIKPLNTTMKDLRKAFSKLTDEQKAQYASSLAGQEAMSGFLAIVNASDGDFDNLTDAINNAEGAASEMAETMNDNLKGKVTLLGSSLEGVGITAYEKFERPLKNAVDGAIDKVNDLSTSMASGELSDSMDTVAEGLGSIVDTSLDLATGAIPLVIDGFAFVVDHGNTIIPVLAGIGAGMIAINTAESISTGLRTASTAATVLYATAQNVLAGSLTLAEGAQMALNVAMGANPFGITAIAIGAVVGGLALLCLNIGETDEETKRLNETLDSNTEKWQQLKVAQEEQLSSDLSQIETTQRLRDELGYLVDENGKVQDGYEARVGFILNELNSALGTEYSMTDGIIGNYNELNGTIDSLIQKKRVKAILDAQEPLYQEAINKQMEEANEISKLSSEIQDKKSRQQEIENELLKKYGDNWLIRANQENDARASEYSSLLLSIRDKQELLDGFEESYNQHTNEIIGYENNMVLASSENSEDWLKIQTDIQAGAATTYSEKKKYLDEEVKALQFTYDDLLKRQADGDERITQSQIDAAKKRVDEKQKELDGMTNSVNKYSPFISKAYKQLSIESLEALKSQSNEYFGVSENQLEDLISGLKSTEPEVRAKSKSIAEEMLVNLSSKNDEYSSTGTNILQGVINGLNNKSGEAYNAIASIGSGMLKTFQDRMIIKSPSRAFKKLAEYIPAGIGRGVLSNGREALSAISELSTDMLNEFKSDDFNIDFSASFDSMRGVAIQHATTMPFSASNNVYNSYENNTDPIDYDKLGRSVAKAMSEEGLEMKVNNREFARLAKEWK